MKNLNLKNNDDVAYLIKKCNKHNRKYQHLLFDTFSSKMFAVCLRYAPDENIANDFFQDNWLIVFDKLNTFNFNGSFEGWIRRIFINNSISILRKEHIFKNVSEITDNNFNETFEIEIGEKNTLDLISYIQKLPTAQRTVFNMFVIDDMKHKDIAKELNISVNTTKTNLYKAKKNLKNMILS